MEDGLVMNNVADLVLKKGEKFYRLGRTLVKVLGISLAVFLLILLIAILGWGSIVIPYVFLVNVDYAFVNFLIGLSYLGIVVGLIGVPFYFWGLHYMGLGQIAKNTEK